MITADLVVRERSQLITWCGPISKRTSALRDLAVVNRGYIERLDSMLLHGTTPSEAQSGYRFNLEDELKQLEARQEANSRHPIDIVPAFLGTIKFPKSTNPEKRTISISSLMKSSPRLHKGSLPKYSMSSMKRERTLSKKLRGSSRHSAYLQSAK